ncbi:MAG TPA: pyridoxal-phosphate dependent enzyme [Ignavibacteriaceae bacterium]|nr:pyridoxal-phosphate dependent enzyme [Ignavibacteriaceae bacterium]
MQDIHGLFRIPSTPLQQIEDEFLFKHKINLYVKREDLNDPELSGNKLHKLKYNLLKAKEENYDTLLTFGGAYSNHIYAVAAAGKRFDFNTIGIIRGEEHLPLNPTLKFAKSCGMNIGYMNRSTYRNKTSYQVISQLKEQFGRFYLIPEGGTNELALKGCAEIIISLDINFDIICTACGTGGTITGLISGLKREQKAIGFAVLKGAEFLNNDIIKLLGLYKMNCLNNWEIKMDYHFGGYGKFTPELIDFINKFESNTNIKVEPVYTGKMFFGIYDMIKNHYIPGDTTIVALHTGGLQGLQGLKERGMLP